MNYQYEITHPWDGATVYNNDVPSDTRSFHPTMDEAFRSGANGNMFRLTPGNAHNGLPVWIEEEGKLYRVRGLVEGVPVTAAQLRANHLVPDMAIPGQIETVITELVKEHNIEKFFVEAVVEKIVTELTKEDVIEKFFTETVVEKLLAEIFEKDTLTEHFIELLFDSELFVEKLQDYWSKTEMRVLSQAEYTATASTIPEGTVVMIKEVQ